MTPNQIAQRLSQSPNDPPSPYFDFVLRSKSILDIAFTHAWVPSGSFSFTQNYEQASPHSVLHLNTSDVDYYQHGIPGATGSVEETVHWLKRIRSEFGFEAVRTVGTSMGGYAAILYGERIGADFICAVSPVLDPSHVFVGNVANILDLHDEIAGIGSRAVLMFGAFDVVDYKDIIRCLDAGLAIRDLAIVGNVHGSATSLNLGRFLSQGINIAKEELMLNPYDILLDEAMIRELAGLEIFRLSDESERAVEVLERAAAIDPFNPDFRFRRSILLHLLGNGGAIADMREAIILSRHHIDKVGAQILAQQADYAKRAVLEYAWKLDYRQLKPLARLVKEAERSLDLPDR